MNEAGTDADVARESDGWARRRSRVATRIEHIAVTLFAERGYANVTVAEVARVAGVSRRTVTRYFPLKEDLMLALPRRRRAAQLAAMRDLAGHPDPVAAMFDVYKSLATLVADEMSHFATWTRAVRQVPELQEKIRSSVELVDPLADRIAESLHVGLLDDVRPAVLSAALVAAVDAATRYWFSRGAVDDWPELLVEVQEALRTGFAHTAE